MVYLLRLSKHTKQHHTHAPLYCRIPNNAKKRVLPTHTALQIAVACGAALHFNLAQAQQAPSTIAAPTITAAEPKPLDCEQADTENTENKTQDNPVLSLADREKSCPPHMRLRTLLALRCKNTQDAAQCAKLIRHKRQLSKTERVELRHALREYARKTHAHSHKKPTP